MQSLAENRKMLDLYSGLGGASEAFLRSGRWDVIRVENNPRLESVPCTDMMDVRELEDWRWDVDIDFVWASPPCREFSQGYNAPGPTAKREGRPFLPDLSLVASAFKIIQKVKPMYWCIENVVGAIEPLKTLLGDPHQVVGPFVLWGNFPLLAASHIKHQKSEQDVWSSDPLRSNKRALIPYELSECMMYAIEHQRRISDWVQIENL